MNLFVKNLSLASPLLIVLLLLPSPLVAAPAVSLSLGTDHITTGKPFSSTLTVSWKGDPDQYLVEPPHLTLPENIEEVGTASRSITRGDHFLLEYSFELRAGREGDYVIEPVAISFWAKGATTAETVKTESLHFTVTAFSLTRFLKYWQVTGIGIIFLSLFITIIVLFTKKKREKRNPGRVTPSLQETITRELQSCSSYKITGDWEKYLTMAIAIRNKLPTEQRGGKAMETLDRLAEKVHYGGLHPTTEEINHIQRHLEHAVRSAFPDNSDEDGESMPLRQ